MKKIIIGLTLIALLYGCRSLHLGGSGKVGGVRTHGGVDIPLPKKL